MYILRIRGRRESMNRKVLGVLIECGVKHEIRIDTINNIGNVLLPRNIFSAVN